MLTIILTLCQIIFLLYFPFKEKCVFTGQITELDQNSKWHYILGIQLGPNIYIKKQQSR